jgi:hypothetical protein
MLPVLAGILIIAIAGHGIVLYRVFSQSTRAVGLALVLLVVVKHAGVFGPIYRVLRRRFRNEGE